MHRCGRKACPPASGSSRHAIDAGHGLGPAQHREPGFGRSNNGNPPRRIGQPLFAVNNVVARHRPAAAITAICYFIGGRLKIKIFAVKVEPIGKGVPLRRTPAQDASAV